MQVKSATTKMYLVSFVVDFVSNFYQQWILVFTSWYVVSSNGALALLMTYVMLGVEQLDIIASSQRWYVEGRLFSKNLIPPLSGHEQIQSPNLLLLSLAHLQTAHSNGVVTVRVPASNIIWKRNRSRLLVLDTPSMHALIIKSNENWEWLVTRISPLICRLYSIQTELPVE